MCSQLAYAPVTMREIALPLGKIQEVIKKFSPGVKLVSTPESYGEVMNFRLQEYARRYPAVPQEFIDPFDSNALVFYSQGACGEIVSTARLVFDSHWGLPDEKVLGKLIEPRRSRGERMMELGRFIIVQDNPALLKAYYRLFYVVTKLLNFDSIVMVLRQKELNFHLKRVGAGLLEFDTGLNFGSKHQFAAIVWSLENTKPRFKLWMGVDDE